MWEITCGEAVCGEIKAAGRARRQSREQVLADFTRELELTPDQEKQLGSILDDSRSKFRTLDRSLDPQRMQIRDQSRAQMRALLTPEQQPKFDAFLQRQDSHRRGDRGR